jgi:hypothetical protein
LSLEVVRGAHSAVLPVTGPRMTFRLDDLAYEHRRIRIDPPAPFLGPGPYSLKAAVRTALDWETVTPLDDLPARTVSARIKKRLRIWKAAQAK